MNRDLVQKHVRHLGEIIASFVEHRPGKKPKLVWFAIERLAMEGILIEELTVDMASRKMTDLASDDNLPRFLRKDAEFYKSNASPFRKDAQWNATKVRDEVRNPAFLRTQTRKMEEANGRNRESKAAGTIPEITTVDNAAEEINTDCVSSSSSIHPPITAIDPEIARSEANPLPANARLREPRMTRRMKARAELTEQGREVTRMYEEIRGRKMALSDNSILAANTLGEVGVTAENLRAIIEMLDNDPWFLTHGIGVDLIWAANRYEGCMASLDRQRKLLAAKKDLTSCNTGDISKLERRQRMSFEARMAERAETRRKKGV